MDSPVSFAWMGDVWWFTMERSPSQMTMDDPGRGVCAAFVIRWDGVIRWDVLSDGGKTLVRPRCGNRTGILPQI